jgi:hypothetical protein
MLISHVHDYPLEDGDATCDPNNRFRLQKNWATYLLRGSESTGLYVATLNLEDIQVFCRDDFIGYRAQLSEEGQTDLLSCYRAWGGEAQIDSHGRFVLPAAVRKVMPNCTGQAFKIISALPVCIVSVAIYNERIKLLQPSQPLHEQSASAYVKFVQTHGDKVSHE